LSSTTKIVLKNIYKKKMASSVTIKDIPSSLFIPAYAEYLKKSGQIEVPSWLDMAKTGSHRIYSPKNPDWFFTRLGRYKNTIFF